MTAGTMLVLCSFATACAVVATFLVAARVHAGMRQFDPPSDPLPLPFRMFWRPSMLLEPAVLRFGTPSFLERTRRALIATGLERVSPGAWISIRMLQGAATSGAVAALCRWTHTSVLVPAAVGAVVGYLGGRLWMKRVRGFQEQAIARELSAYLDLLVVCVESGATLTSGVRLVVEQAPASPLRRYFQRVLREIRGGRSRSQAFSHVADIYSVASLSSLAAALVHGERSGMSLGAVLRAQAEQRTAERFARAERLAMQAPVKLLGPLILCIFPCTFVILAVPITVKLMEAFGK
jgi:tight adherence protein C